VTPGIAAAAPGDAASPFSGTDLWAAITVQLERPGAPHTIIELPAVKCPRMIKRTAVVSTAPSGQASREKFGLLVACLWSSFAEGAKRAPSPDLLPELRRRFAVLGTALRPGVRSGRRAARHGLA